MKGGVGRGACYGTRRTRRFEGEGTEPGPWAFGVQEGLEERVVKRDDG